VVGLLRYKLGSLGSVCLPFIVAVSLKSSLIGTVHMYRAMTETLHTEKSNKMQQCIKIYYSIFV